MVSDQDVLRECISESHYRSFPCAVFTALNVRYLIRKRTLWLNGWPVVLGASCLAWIVGKLSYIQGKHCQDKFIEKAPNSRITENILMSRALEERGSSKERKERSTEEIMDIPRVDGHVDSTSKEERSTLQKCNSTAFWEYSLPAMACVSCLGKIQKKVTQVFLSCEGFRPLV